MKKHQIVITIVLLALGLGVTPACAPIQLRADPVAPTTDESDGDRIMLPEAVYISDMPVEQAMLERRSVRQFQKASLTTAELSQLLWAAQGVTHPNGLRTVPSAGALYPLEVYVVVGNVGGLNKGIYHYDSRTHELVQTAEGDKRAALSQSALGQDAVAEAAAVIVLAAIYDRTTGKYGDRGIRYVHMEVGASAQNVYLQSESLGLGTVFIGAFSDEQVKDVLDLRDAENPLCLLPVGRPL